MPGDLVARGKVIKFGSSISVAEALVYDGANNLLASGRGVYSTAPAPAPKA
jgi:acyl-coenzyme A thioesterase PaaI-like protein